MTSLSRLFRLLRPYRAKLALGILLLSITVATDLSVPRLMQIIVDRGIRQRDMQTILTMSAAMIGVTVVGVVVTIANMLLAVRVSQQVGAELRQSLFERIQSFSSGNLDRLQTGQLMTRLSSDITQVTQLVVMSMRMFVRAPLMIVGSLVPIFLTSWQIGSWMVLLMAGVIVLFGWYVGRAQPFFLQVQKRRDRLNTIFQENLAGVRVVRAFVRAVHENQRFGVANTDLAAQSMRVGRLLAVLLPTVRWLVNLGLVAVVWFGGGQVVRGSLSLGQIIALNNYIFWVMFPLLNVGMSVGFISSADASLQRIFEVVDSSPEVQDQPGAVSIAAAQGRVAFENVSFDYNHGGGHEMVLQGINLVAEPGQTVAIVGATGSGKSSLVHLVPRFYDVTDGRVTLDGRDVRELTLDSLRAQIGVVMQDTVLFSGTIRDNIRYGRPDATDEEVEAAARAAQAHDFIQSFPAGYDSPIGQRGVNLSGGQKQRLAIARALLLLQPVLILDDSTSSVDVQTEGLIQEALRTLRQGRTTLVVAQRISSVLQADRIAVLDRGRLVASGSHHELWETSPVYREIFQSQMGNGRQEVSDGE